MRGLVLVAVLLVACSNQPNAVSSPTVTPTSSPTPTRTATSSPTPSPAPISLPTTAQLSASSGGVVWAFVGGTRLFRSSDRGDTWVERSTPPTLVSTEMSFGDDRNGLLLTTGNPMPDCQTQTASIGKTADGAATWQRVTATGIADPMCKRGLAVADATRAFFTTYSPNAGSLVYRTADGGATWIASSPLPIPPNLASHGALFVSITARPRAFGSTVLVEGGAGQTKDVFRSTDGGGTFTYASTFEASAIVAYVTATRWLQIGPPGAGTSMETTDGGVTWHAYATDYSQAAPVAPEIVFGDAQTGYATVRGEIQRTTDGGAHWTKIKTPGTG